MSNQVILQSKIAERVKSDSAFRTALLENPQDTLKNEFGVDISDQKDQIFTKKIFFALPSASDVEVQGFPVEW